MTPEQGYDAAKFQRPGIKIVMGPHAAKESPISPLSHWAISKLPGHASWSDRDLQAKLGFLPSMWAQCFACIAQAFRHDVTVEEWKWLHGSATLSDAIEWSVRIVIKWIEQKEQTQ